MFCDYIYNQQDLSIDKIEVCTTVFRNEISVFIGEYKVIIAPYTDLICG